MLSHFRHIFENKETYFRYSAAQSTRWFRDQVYVAARTAVRAPAAAAPQPALFETEA
jgi:hypothetical protein